jgi:hypothetical protein
VCSSDLKRYARSERDVIQGIFGKVFVLVEKLRLLKDPQQFTMPAFVFCHNGIYCLKFTRNCLWSIHSCSFSLSEKKSEW